MTVEDIIVPYLLDIYSCCSDMVVLRAYPSLAWASMTALQWMTDLHFKNLVAKY